MRILVLEWDSFGQEYLMEAFCKEGCRIEIYPWPFGQEDMRNNEKVCNDLKNKLKATEPDFVFSFNFFPIAAEACHAHGIKYVSWIYDTPYLLLYSKHIRYETNFIFFFDKSLYEEFNNNGINNVYYLPLAAPVDIYDKVSVGADKYCADISFVGSTYRENRQNFYQLFKGISDFAEGYLDGIMKMQKSIYGSFILEDLLTAQIVDELRKVCPIQKGEDEWESDAWIYANYFLARKLTGEQRTEILKLLSERHQVKLYAPEQSLEIGNVENCGPVDYVTEMPQVFKNTKINLNMTLRSIHSGMPLRAMDIMGCGGFLLTNYQNDFLDFFVPDEDYVYYVSNEDLLYKVDYYLSHDEERKAIARNGYEKVKAGHTYTHRVRSILELLDEKR